MFMKRFIFGFILVGILSGLVYFSYNFFKTPTYKIRFNSNGGTKVEVMEIKENDKVSSLPKITKDNYNFLGWYNNDVLFDVNMPISKDYNLEAKWEEKDIPTYTIKFNTLTNEEIEPLIIKEGEVIDGLPVIESKEQTFIGWSYQNKKIEKLVGSKDMTLVALWKR